MKKYSKDKKADESDELELQIKATHHFDVPEGFFDNLHKNLMTTVSTLTELEKAKGEQVFATPNYYFENLPDQIQKRLPDRFQRSSWQELIYLLLRPQISIAFASLLIICWFGFHTCIVRTIDAPRQSFSLTDLGNSVYIMDYDEGTLIDYLVASSSSEQNNSSTFTDTYIQYLIDNNIDLTQLEKTM